MTYEDISPSIEARWMGGHVDIAPRRVIHGARTFKADISAGTAVEIPCANFTDGVNQLPFKAEHFTVAKGLSCIIEQITLGPDDLLPEPLEAREFVATEVLWLGGKFVRVCGKRMTDAWTVAVAHKIALKVRAPFGYPERFEARLDGIELER